MKICKLEDCNIIIKPYKKFCCVDHYRKHQRTSKEYRKIYENKKTGEYRDCSGCEGSVYCNQNSLKTQSKFFCNRECYLKYHSNLPAINCYICNKEFIVGKYKEKEYRRFCSPECYNKYRKTNEFKDKMSLIKMEKYREKGLGSCNDNYCDAWRDEEFKDDIRKDNCEICGMTTEESLQKWNQKLILHHLDNDGKNCTPKNLKTLCRSCHPRIHGIERGGLNESRIN